MLNDADLHTSTRVVLPSMTFPAVELRKIHGIRFYEERFFILAVASAANAGRAVYVTSVPIAPEIVDYYASLTPDPERTRERITLIALDDPEPRALSEKLVDRPDVLARIRDAAGPDAYLFPFNVTGYEARIADALAMPIYGPDADHMHLGSKTGSRTVAKRAGAGVLDGAEALRSIDDIEAAIGRIRPGAGGVVIKFNYGFSGMGNAIIHRDELRSPLTDSPILFCSDDETWETYLPKITEQGAIVEELVSGEGVTSPSVQVQILPSGRVEIISTHDQVLGDPRNQVYLGCRFPAAESYRGMITDQARAMARVLAEEGVIGPFGVDFIVVPDDGAFVSEINLRMGGTTHPFAMARFVTRGEYDQLSGELIAADSRPRYYVGTDNLKTPALAGRSPAWVLERLDRAGLLFDPSTLCGVTVHMLGAVEDYGKLGTVCIAPTRAEAMSLSQDAAGVLTTPR